jgi:uncharacterized membrane protein YkvA (DUF1232 family)
MAARITSWLWRPGLLRTLLYQARLAARLLREPRVPLLTKAVPMIACLYLVSPIDVVPDFVPVIGQTDDLTLLLVALALFVRLCPASTVSFHRDAVAEGRRYSPVASTDDVIDAEWRREP